MLTEQEISNYVASQNKIMDAADILLSDYRAIHVAIFGDKSYSYRGYSLTEFGASDLTFPDVCLVFQDLDSETIDYCGDEYWSYGGHEHHTFQLPTSYLYDPTWKSTISEIMLGQKARYDATIERKVQAKKDAELKQLEELRSKYGDQS